MRYVVDDRFIDKVEELIGAVKDSYSSRLNPMDRARWSRAHTIAMDIKWDIEDGFEEERCEDDVRKSL